MGRVNLIHDEAWRAARLVVSHFHPRLDDAELVEAFHRVREVIADAMRRLHERSVREASRIRPVPTTTTPTTPSEKRA